MKKICRLGINSVYVLASFLTPWAEAHELGRTEAEYTVTRDPSFDPRAFAACLASAADAESPARILSLKRVHARLYAESGVKESTSRLFKLMRSPSQVGFHSLPLINADRHLSGDDWRKFEPTELLLLKSFKTLNSKYGVSGFDKGVTSPEEFQAVFQAARAASAEEFPKREEQRKYFEKLRAQSQQRIVWPSADGVLKASFLAQPLVDWLLAQPPGSVAPWTLVKKGLEFYRGDLLTALGVIGDMFSGEVIVPSLLDGVSRKHLPLASRMKPLVSGSADDPVGHNYHFWAYLNLAIQGYGPSLKAKSFVYEKLWQRDDGDYQADHAGIEAGALARQFILKRNQEKASCAL
jgi:hypothetical protein